MKTQIYCDRVIEFFLYVLIFCLPFSKAIIEISATFIILAWIVKKIFNWQPISTYLNIPILVFILANFLSVIFSTNFTLSLRNFGSKTMEYILLYFIVSEFMVNKRRVKNFVIVTLVSAAMVALDCIFQYFVGFDFLRFYPLDIEMKRITGCFQMPSDLSGYLGPILCLSLAISFMNLRRGIKYFLRAESVVLLSLLIVVASRGAWLGVIAGVFFLGMLEDKRIMYVTAIFLLILGVLLPNLLDSPYNMVGRFFNASDPDRKTMWLAAWRMIKDKPLFGHGFTTFMGNFARYGKEYKYLELGMIPYAHNCYLQMAAETGITGLISFLMLIGTFFIHTISSLAKIKDRFNHAVLSGISAGLIVTLVHSAVDTNLYSLKLSVLFWIMLGLNAALQRRPAFEKTTT